MKRKIFSILFCALILLSLSACTIKSSKAPSEDEISERKEAFENYLKETYPDETFTVDVWTEYGTSSASGLPSFEGYLWRQVITDSKGNHFKIYTSEEGTAFNHHTRYYDDYQSVLDGKIHYNEHGQRIFLDEYGNVEYEWY